ncbi:MAG TPA: 2-C-methyl-D-erythritol 2,4-cyclodiphosphate synthase [Actinomycetota bacterium]|nr:2-C-methyl-D-erythritol 2,4-cyclodiphosphate synthase [Actinomycetota bacterium]
MPEGVGLGFDVHARDASRPLWLGALLFEAEPGLAGHSDGDVVCHAIADALLGAGALGDVGEHFPETDAANEGISGAAILGTSAELIARRGLSLLSFDVTVVCDRPAIAPRRDEMRARLAEITGLSADRVSVKGTRPEGLGLTGEGIGCLAVALLR